MFDNVLVIDDDPIFCQLLQTYLERSGVKKTSVASNGHDAAEVLQRDISQIDFVVLDLNMPELDGIELLAKLKDMSYSGPIAVVSSETPVVIDMAASLARQYGLKIIDAIKKPLSMSDINRWLSNESSGADR